MTHPTDPRLPQAKAIPITEIVNRLGIAGLRPNGWELSGPCPLCGDTGHNPKSGPSDRFNINLRTNAFLCRKCDLRGGDTVGLVMGVMGLKFFERDPVTKEERFPVLDWICGESPAGIDPKEAARRQAAAEKAAEAAATEKAAEEDRYRRRAIASARAIWGRARPGHMGIVRAYLNARGITPDLYPDIPQSLRFIVDHPYVKQIGGEYVTAHRGPCMIAGIIAPNGMLSAVHQTWVDPNPPHGKARISHAGEKLPAKLVRGSKKGGAIRLHTPEGAEVLVMGEGIETTLTALIAQPYANAAYWAGVDLGNMSGRMRRVPGTRHSGLPDMADKDAFVPPPWVRRLIFVMDGDSDPRATRAKLESGLRRAMAVRPGLIGQIVHPGQGVDLNDVLNATPQASGPATTAENEPGHTPAGPMAPQEEGKQNPLGASLRDTPAGATAPQEEGLG